MIATKRITATIIKTVNNSPLSELCRRSADLDEDDQERCDRRARRQHLGHQRRLHGKSAPPVQAPAAAPSK